MLSRQTVMSCHWYAWDGDEVLLLWNLSGYWKVSVMWYSEARKGHPEAAYCNLSWSLLIKRPYPDFLLGVSMHASYRQRLYILRINESIYRVKKNAECYVLWHDCSSSIRKLKQNRVVWYFGEIKCLTSPGVLTLYHDRWSSACSIFQNFRNESHDSDPEALTHVGNT